MLAALGPQAGAVTNSEVDAAKARVAELERQIEVQEARLAGLESQAAALAVQLSAAQGRLEQIAGGLAETRDGLAAARAEYEDVRARLDERAHHAYMEGPGTGLEFLLGATSLADLSDRLEFIDALSESDADLANEAQNLANELRAQERRLRGLQAEQAKVVNGLRVKKASLIARLAEQKAVVDDIEAKKAEAQRIAQELGREYQRQLAQRFGGPIGDGPIEICPVGQPRAFGDDFGAPRYAGGYHPHAGNDIFAPEGTPIYAPFDGVAEAASNGLGGLSVIVRGSEGYVYNAHLSRFGKLGPVSTGDVVGYVGNTGDAIGTSPHDHFEWHPTVIPSNWPASGYGYSVVGDAINPRPLLLQVC
ncbi:MAG: peptidoglycan DD-metalloendopeptidase family protein [Actinobacteria bacterium]|nr:peptidoglycan DD-metalloendopeptidase family protein [Actinomycetota bacterium]